MSIQVNLDELLKKSGVSSKDLAARIGLSEVNLSRMRTGKIKAVRFSTLEAICHELDCQPGDILTYIPEKQTALVEVPESIDANMFASVMERLQTLEREYQELLAKTNQNQQNRVAHPVNA